MESDTNHLYYYLALPPQPENPALDLGLAEWRAECQRDEIARLQAECERLKNRIAELEAAQRQPAAADPDLRLLLDGVERLRARLYPPVETAFPTTIHGVQLSKAQQRLVEGQVYAWRNPTDGSGPLPFRAIAKQLGCTIDRARRLADQATWRHEGAD